MVIASARCEDANGSHPDEEILSGPKQSSPTTSGQAPLRSPRQRILSSPLWPTTGEEAHISPVTGAIGLYKGGKIEWGPPKQLLDQSSSKRRRSWRPKIQVVIPIEDRNRPLPTSPFFGKAPFSQTRGSISTPNHISSDSADFSDASPLSGMQKGVIHSPRTPPLAFPQLQPLPLFQALDISQLSSPQPIDLDAMARSIPSRSASSDDSPADDASSTYSQASSSSSIEAEHPPLHPRLDFHQRSASATFSLKSPAQAGIFDDGSTGVGPGSVMQGSETGPRIAMTIGSSPKRQYTPHPPIEHDVEFKPTCELKPLRSVAHALQRKPTLTRRSSKRVPGPRSASLSANTKMGFISESYGRSASWQFPRHDLNLSPTLSEAENELEQQLQDSFFDTDYEHNHLHSSMADDNPFIWDDVVSRGSSFDVAEPVMTPTLPRKSSKRDVPTLGPCNMSTLPQHHIASQMVKSPSLRSNPKGLKIEIPGQKRVVDSFVLSPIFLGPVPALERTISPSMAEDVILTIFRSLDSLDDLFSMALVNRGFYEVFKRHELDLLKETLRKQCPPAWEYREICYPGHEVQNYEDLEVPMTQTEYTPQSYWQYLTRDMYIIAAIKSLIKDNCESFVRPEISCALISSDPLDSARVDNALWRIWTFCKIFGSRKGREDDIVAQMEWLKGGAQVHQQTASFNILTADAFDMSDTLANAPECFALGNEGGLNPEELFDMMEIWNCLGVLVAPFEGRTIQAREFGLYEQTEVRGGDIDGEEQLLDEWCYFVLTLGLSPILDLTAPCRQSDPSAFILAHQNGWMDWKPPMVGATRRNFLKDAASRVYEEEIAAAYAETDHREVQRQLSKQRIQRHITELRHRQHSNEQSTEGRPGHERPISEWSANVITNLTRPTPPVPSGANLVTHVPTLSVATSTSQVDMSHEHPALRTSPEPPRPSSPPRRIVAQPLLPSPPPSTVPSMYGDYRRSVASSMPSIDEHPVYRNLPASIPEVPSLEDHPAFRNRNGQASERTGSSGSGRSQHSVDDSTLQQNHQQIQRAGGQSMENTVDQAIHQLRLMGFTAAQAKYALRVTDLGDGQSLPRAINHLVAQDGRPF